MRELDYNTQSSLSMHYQQEDVLRRFRYTQALAVESKATFPPRNRLKSVCYDYTMLSS